MQQKGQSTDSAVFARLRTLSSIRSRETLVAEQANRALADFLLIDIQTALTFSGIALSSDSLDKRQRTTIVARKAYDTITRLRAGVRLTQIEAENLARNLRRLEIELEVLGAI